MRARGLTVFALLSLLLAAPSAWGQSPPAAKAGLLSVLFGHGPGSLTGPTTGPSHSIGTPANGCLAGGRPLPLSGPGWQVLRPDRDRYWGNQALVDFLRDKAGAAHADGLGTLLVADMAQARGGPMPSDHGSHQTGVDVDILYRLARAPLTADERDHPDLTGVVRPDGSLDPRRWGEDQERLVRLFARDPRVDRIFVNPQIKRALCRWARGDRTWLRRVRPWWGHMEHFHVRIQCPVGDMDCRSGPLPPPGDGCGGELRSWIDSGAWKGRPSGGHAFKRPPPLACRDILGRK